MAYLNNSISAYRTIRERILSLHDDLDEVTLADTLEGETDLHEVIAAVVRSALVDEAKAEGLRDLLTTFRERLDRLKQRARHQREIAKDAMVEVGLKRVDAPDFTLSVRPGTPSVVIFDEALIPSDYWEPQEPKLSRQALLADVKRGLAVPGAAISSPVPVMSVRIK